MRKFLYILFFIPSLSYSQTGFEGIIEFKIKSEGSTPEPTYGNMTFLIRGQDFVIKLDGPGYPASKMLYRNSDHAMYIIDDAGKNIIKLDFSIGQTGMPIGEVPEEYKKTYQEAMNAGRVKNEKSKISLENTGESSNILGYACMKYKVSDESDIQSFVWLAGAIHVDFPEGMDHYAGPLDGLLTHEGFPLRIENSSRSQGLVLKMIAEAQKVQKTSLSHDLFEVPTGYHVEDIFNYLNN
jgi:hypothetical protein